MFQFDADHVETESGVWEEFQGSEFLIAHTSSMKFQKALARGQQPYVKKIQNSSLDPAVNKKVICRAMAEGMLLDWRKVKDSNGKEVEYTIDRGYQALMGQPEFRDFVSEFSMQITNFRKEMLDSVGEA